LGANAIEQFVAKLRDRHTDLYDQFFSRSNADVFPPSESLDPAARGRTAGRRGKQRGQTAPPSPSGPLETKEMEGLLWRAACSIRGEKDAPKFKDYILPLIFIKRLSDVFEDEVSRLAEEYGDEKTAQEIEKGRPKNFIPDDGIAKIADAVRDGKDIDGFSKAVPVGDLADFNLSPSRYVAAAAVAENRDIQTILDDLAGLEAEEKRLDGDLKGIFEGLGYRWGAKP
jgi:type I restriction-modification system DNA methylase subunit